MRLPALALLLASAGLAASPETDPPRLPTVAVMPLEAKGTTAGEADLITDALASKLLAIGKFSVMERSQMNQILREQSFQQSGACDNSGCAIEIGRLLAVERILVGSVGRIGEAHLLNVRLVRVETGEILASASAKRGGGFARAQQELVGEVVGELTGTRRSRAWMWWTAGGVALAGGAAAVLLLRDEEATAPTTGEYVFDWSEE